MISGAGYTVSVKDQPGQVSILAYSINAQLKGKIRLASVGTRDASILRALLSDSDANEIPYEILPGTTLPTAETATPRRHVANYPNPFGEHTIIEFYSAGGGSATLEVYDLSGKIVATESFNIGSGNNKYRFSRGVLSSGVYIYIIKNDSSGEVLQGKMTIK